MSTDGLVIAKALLVLGLVKGLLEWSDGLGKGLECGVGMGPVAFGQLFTGHLVEGLGLDKAGHFTVGMLLCFDCLAGSC